MVETATIDIVTPQGKDLKGLVVFEDWIERDIGIVADKYLHPKDENSFPNMIRRVVDTIAGAGVDGDFVVPDQEQHFANQLYDIVKEQKATWNSPVWFNVGIEEEPQCWACLILRLDDAMHSQ